MKKRLAPILALLLAFSLCACAAPAPAPTETPAAVAPEANAVPGMEGTLQEYAREHGGLPEEVSEAAGTREPFIPEGLNKVVIGADNRVTVLNTRDYPYCAIGLMRVHASCGCSWQGSGFMVGPSGFVTAAHCLCCSEHRSFADRLEIYFGYESDSNYYYKFDKACTFWVGTTFEGGYTNENAEWDYGYIKLSERVGDYTGTFGSVNLGDEALSGAYLEAAGYRDGLLKYDFGLASVDSSQVISFDADTQPGNSGGPLFFAAGEYANYAVAINIAESAAARKNYARRLTYSVLQGMIDQGVIELP